MSSSQFSQESDQNDTEIVSLVDDVGRSIDCYIENYIEKNGLTYLLLLPVDSPVMILTWDEIGDNEEEIEADTMILEDDEEIADIFPDAKAVLAELDLTLKNTAYTLTVSGDLPPIEDDDIISLELDTTEEDGEEELQCLTSFHSQDQKYYICTPLSPMFLVARDKLEQGLEVLTPDDPDFSPILNEFLTEEELEEG